MLKLFGYCLLRVHFVGVIYEKPLPLGGLAVKSERKRRGRVTQTIVPSHWDEAVGKHPGPLLSAITYLRVQPTGNTISGCTSGYVHKHVIDPHETRIVRQLFWCAGAVVLERLSCYFIAYSDLLIIFSEILWKMINIQVLYRQWNELRK